MSAYVLFSILIFCCIVWLGFSLVGLNRARSKFFTLVIKRDSAATWNSVFYYSGVNDITEEEAQARAEQFKYWLHIFISFTLLIVCVALIAYLARTE